MNLSPPPLFIIFPDINLADIKRSRRIKLKSQILTTLCKSLRIFNLADTNRLRGRNNSNPRITQEKRLNDPSEEIPVECYATKRYI